MHDLQRTHRISLTTGPLSLYLDRWIPEILRNHYSLMTILHLFTRVSAHQVTSKSKRLSVTELKCTSNSIPYCDFRTWIVNTRLFLQPTTTTRMSIRVAVKQIVLFTMLQSFLGIAEEWHFISFTYYIMDTQQWDPMGPPIRGGYIHAYRYINHTNIGVHLSRRTYTYIPISSYC